MNNIKRIGYFADQYSLLHLSVGIIFYFWGISFFISMTIHMIFEILENTPLGIFIINKYFTDLGFFGWPGGKSAPDTIINIFGDNVFFAIGWYIARIVDYCGSKYGLYPIHIK